MGFDFERVSIGEQMMIKRLRETVDQAEKPRSAESPTRPSHRTKADGGSWAASGATSVPRRAVAWDGVAWRGVLRLSGPGLRAPPHCSGKDPSRPPESSLHGVT